MTAYIVSGHYRTGTSMMMHALVAGGMEAVYDEHRQHILDKKARDDYHPNKNGVYEVHGLMITDGKVVKLFGRELVEMRDVYDFGMRIVYMTRNAWEIRASIALINNKLLPDKNKRKQHDRHDEIQQSIIRRLANRRDVWSLDVFDYHDVLNNPVGVFGQLEEHGWKVDVDKAVATIDPSLCHIGG